jgi:hypothetical protein
MPGQASIDQQVNVIKDSLKISQRYWTARVLLCWIRFRCGIFLVKKINNAGLELEAIENFDPADWYDILLDGPNKKHQIELIKQLIRNVGQAGIPVIGYNFSLAGFAAELLVLLREEELYLLEWIR